MIIIAIAPFVALIGLLIYALTAPANTKVCRIGEIMFFCGLLATLLMVAEGHVHLP